MAAEEAELERINGGGGGKKKMTAKEKAAAAAAAAEAAVELPTCMSGKLAVLEELLGAIYLQTPDRVVVCSSYTNTLDMLQQMCERQKWEFLRLDGSVSISQRQGLVDAFNRGAGVATRKKGEPFVFLLSTRAGGQGLNLVGGNRLVLFDSCFNPSADLQAQARVWRDGQTKPCVLYRLLSTGTMEEKVFQRQISKRELHSTLVEDAGHDIRNFSPDELRKLFILTPANIRCETYDLLRQGGGGGREGGGGGKKKRWKDYRGAEDISDACLRSVVEAGREGGKLVSFVHEEEEEEEEEKKEEGGGGGGGEGGAAPMLVCGADVLEEGEEEEEEWEEGGGFGKVSVVADTGATPKAKGKRKKVMMEEEDEEEDEEESSEDELAGDTGAGGGEKKAEEEEEGSKTVATKHVSLEEHVTKNEGVGNGKEDEDAEEEEEWDALLNT